MKDQTVACPTRPGRYLVMYALVGVHSTEIAFVRHVPPHGVLVGTFQELDDNGKVVYQWKGPVARVAKMYDVRFRYLGPLRPS